MVKRSMGFVGSSLQLGIFAAATLALAPTQVEAMLVCTINAEAKSIPIYDKPGGAEVRRADVDPAWKSGSSQPAHGQGGDSMMEMWVEIQDQTGAPVGFVKVGDGSAVCKGDF